MIRLAREADLPVLREVERAAGEPFAELGMDLVATDEPPSVAVLREFQEAGRAWVHVVEDVPVAYLIAEVVDGCAHVEQVSVRPDHGGRRIGSGLIDNLAAWARDRRLPALTLTTFTDVPWNGPYYLRCGFRYLADDELTPGLRDIRAAEAVAGLDAWPRACMRRDL
ncbi:GNAT family N-acetyltransferase [Saccharopolyspora sp. TS4A08]|uniref:GNAT family N-acetyltransferase n=1 Tax=Saccharopolyspora ipomoeae TaxID=3042027 RepID=A0ABT6PMW0_9PSEU|nr:GNAT family N-acetyltransferase [Saccharopolyspora sp. TS4A08]MDI2029343.1 GNAT family N-acetyltransferase [Saccharopolyspora sp. TS4A08]